MVAPTLPLVMLSVLLEWKKEEDGDGLLIWKMSNNHNSAPLPRLCGD